MEPDLHARPSGVRGLRGRHHPPAVEVRCELLHVAGKGGRQARRCPAGDPAPAGGPRKRSSARHSASEAVHRAVARATLRA